MALHVVDTSAEAVGLALPVEILLMMVSLKVKLDDETVDAVVGRLVMKLSVVCSDEVVGRLVIKLVGTGLVLLVFSV